MDRPNRKPRDPGPDSRSGALSMATDNDPVDYRYISARLTRELVQQHEAARPRKRWTGGMNVHGIELRRNEEPINFENRFELAARTTAAVKNLTGTLASPADFVHETMELSFMKVKVHIGFKGTGHQLVAGYFSDLDLPGLGRVFIALFGSITNVRGWRVADDLQADVSPSDAAGLYEILASTLEANDAPIIKRYLKDERQLSAEDRFNSAHGIAFRHNEPLTYSGEFEFLAVNHGLTHDISLDHQHYDVAVLGAPIWIKTPPPVPFV
jgi:hypothetical protein